MSAADELAGIYVLDRQTYLADMRDAIHTQVAELEAMLRKAQVAEEFAPSELGAQRLVAFEAGVEKVRGESESLLERVPDPLAVQLELCADGTFHMTASTPAGEQRGSGTWSQRESSIILLHLRENGSALATPVSEEMALRDGMLEKRASAEHFPFFLRPQAQSGS